MNIRETIEKWEQETLSPYASLSANTRGRERKEPLCDIRPEYQRDRDRILHSKSFRRLKQKTQVFLAPEGDHYRTRLTHTLEVSQIARTIAKALRLNESLAEAIALGHDLGHTPFGHSGEAVLNRALQRGVRALSAECPDGGGAGAEGAGAEPDLGGSRRDPEPPNERSSGDAGRERLCGFPIKSPTSTMISTMRSGERS